MKKRIRNLITTSIGIAVVLFAFVMFYLGKVQLSGFVTLLILGWVFVSAKDTLLEGITAGLFRINEKK